MLRGTTFCKYCIVVDIIYFYVPNKNKTFKANFNLIMYEMITLLLQRFKNSKCLGMTCSVTVEFIVSSLASL